MSARTNDVPVELARLTMVALAGMRRGPVTVIANAVGRDWGHDRETGPPTAAVSGPAR